MRSIKMDFVRSGGDTSVLTEGQAYLVVIDSSRHRQFTMPVDQEHFLDRLSELRYHQAFTAAQQAAALESLAATVTTILEPPDEAGDSEGLQLDLVTNARELWALPFEAARAADGQPLFARKSPRVVLTRRVAQPFAERQPAWPPRPRVLFVHASPAWASPSTVPASAHKDALLKALQPWVEPLRGLPILVGQEESVLTTLKDATLAAIEAACRKAEADKRPFTHVHLLAHGVLVADPARPHRSRYGIALESANGAATEPEAIVRAIRPPDEAGASTYDTPIVVTLAICDGGNAANTIIQAGGLAQELHRAGVPIVIASQLPLTFPGSEIMTGVFYQAWMDGKDVRQALHETRVALHDAAVAGAPGHDWVSLVAYVRLPEGYRDYLYDVRLTSELAALETASNHARYLLEQNITDAFQVGQVTTRLQGAARRLETSLNELDAAAHKPKNEVIQENAGLLGSALKRLAELLAWRASAAPEARDQWLAESHAAVAKARDAYHAGFKRNPSHHWTGVQYLALDAVLSGGLSNVPAWYTCYFSATGQRDDPTCPDKDRIWALGSIAELGLLASLGSGLSSGVAEAGSSLTDLSALVATLGPGTFTGVSPIESTRRQFLRYADWWTTANGFFPGRAADLAADAKTLAARLGA